MMNNIPYGKQTITEEDIEAVVKTLRSDFLTQGPQVAEFEKAFAEYTGAKYAVAVSNGTAALHLCAMALNVKPGTNVITTPITFAASANCIKYCGGNIFFCDINPETFLMDTEKLKELISSKPKGFFSGIIPVDFAGLVVNLEEIKKIATANNLWIIEDACHAPGGFFTDKTGIKQQAGNSNFADLAIFSFHPVKHIATGEGGMITTNDKTLFDKLCLYRTHGITKNAELMTQNDGGWYYQMIELGYNYRMPDMLCALGISQLKRADEGLKRRREIASKYNEAFKNNPQIKIQNSDIQSGHAFHLYIIRIKNRLELYDHLKANKIFAQVHYIPVHTMPYYQNLGFKKGDFPVAEAYYEECLSLPLFPGLTNEEQKYVIETIQQFVK
ncbi:MAG: UDP-4-amino-4,6-dideoxy-N-acetyl-beta-L-altrosamine transaminase [Bacteroidetes bacterium]|nr:UDP-4-amino-4,6-dideoxy-N-acetyl-beta-L-altrosamine transaminase [Bacteroidota bacterium]